MKEVALQRFNAFRTSRFWFAGADVLSALLAVALPWSTTAFLILLAPLLVVICGSVDVKMFLRSARRAPSRISIAFFLLALFGVLWSEAGVSNGLHGLGPLVKFLVLPFFLYYFEKSGRGAWVLAAFLVSCILLLINSWLITFEPGLAFKTGRCCGEDYGVSVRNYIDQSQEFSICLVGLCCAALYSIQSKMWVVFALLFAAATAFAVNMVFVAVSRTAIICLPVMLVVLAWRHGRARGMLLVMGAGGVMLTAAWFASPQLRLRVMSTYSQFQEYHNDGAPSSVGKRLEFWRKSIVFFREAPLIGHGTGSTLHLFEQAAIGQTAVTAEVVANPHNQTFSIVIQWGVSGLIVLYALWFFHLRMFFKGGFIADLGLMLVVQSIIGSLFNSHLSDFAEGWLYVLGVGAAGGILAKCLALRDEHPATN